ncbi:T9SS type A sorting domain-containing protein, partial [Aequorivita sp. SDUM287046]
GPAQDLGSVSLYPVPTKHLLNVGNPQNLELESLQIFDLRGRLVQRADLRGMGSKRTLDVSTLGAAVYMVRIQGQNGTTTKRLVKE